MKKENERLGTDSSSSSNPKKISIEKFSPLQISFKDSNVQERKEGINHANNDDIKEEEMKVRP